MDFEQLITLIFVLAIWGISNVFRKAAKTDPRNHASAQQTPGFLETLQKTLAAALQDQRSPDREELELDEYLQVPTGPPLEDRSGHASATMADDRQPEIHERRIKSAPSPPFIPPAGPPQITRLQKSKLPAGRRSLRNAVIWSEILAPPLALRDPQ